MSILEDFSPALELYTDNEEEVEAEIEGNPTNEEGVAQPFCLGEEEEDVEHTCEGWDEHW